MNLGAPELTLLLVASVALLLVYGLAIWTVVDAARRPDWQFEASGQSKVLWIVLPIVGMIVCQLVSIVGFIVYMTSVRPKLERARRPSGPPTGWPGPSAAPSPPASPPPPPPPRPGPPPPPRSDPPPFG
jgi:hypothetical protein